MLFTDCSLSKRRQTHVNCEQNAFLVCRRNKLRNFTTNQASYSQNTWRRWQSSVLKFWQVKLCLFDFFEFIAETSEKVFVYKCKLSLSLALLYLVDLFINNLKTKFNNLFYRMIFNTKRINNSFWRNFPARAKQTPSKVLFVAKKKPRPRPFGHIARQNCNRWQQ